MLEPLLERDTDWVFWESGGGADILLEGSFKLESEGISFQPKIQLVSFKSTAKGKKTIVPWNRVGTFPEICRNEYKNLIGDTILSQKLPYLRREVSPREPLDLFTLSEFQEYISSSQENPKAREEALDKLIRSSPQFGFFSYAKAVWLAEGGSNLADIWSNYLKNPSIDPYYNSRLSFRLGSLSFQKRNYDKAKEFFEYSKNEREKLGLIYQPDYAKILAKLGSIALAANKKDEALFYFTTAKELFISLKAEQLEANYLNSWNYAILLGELKQKEIALSSLFHIEPKYRDNKDFESAVFYFDLARLEFQLGNYASTLFFTKVARERLFGLALTNHDLYFDIMNLEASSHFKEGKWVLAKSLWEKIILAKLVLPIEDRNFYRSSLYNQSVLHTARGSEKEAEEAYKYYARLTPYNQILEKSSGYLDLPKLQYPEFAELPVVQEFTLSETGLLRSYTGKYLFQVQEEEQRARTYENRLEDTNEFLKDLLDSSKFGSPSLQILRRDLRITEISSRGRGAVFIDIGPALNNTEAPGITSQSMAYSFPDMEIVLLELPKETELFLSRVSDAKKEELYSFPNIRILVADGVGPFAAQFEDRKLWLLRNRPTPDMKNKLLVFRAANSIDIYESFDKILPHFQELAKVYSDNPIIYFFNRSILIKRPKEAKFSVIGIQSIRGFHHNFQSLDRNGEPPYTLAEYALRVD